MVVASIFCRWSVTFRTGGYNQMDSSSKRLLIYVLALQPFFVIALLTYYQFGYKKLGDPLEYRKQKQEMIQAIQDSILAQQSVFSPENVGDSTMVGLEMHVRMFEETHRYDNQITEVRSALDSLQREKDGLATLKSELERQQAVLDDLRNRSLDEKIVNLANIYDNMKAPQSAPLFIEMNDTLAVMIMMNMQDRNASRALGAIAESDINKATRITKLLAMMGVIKLD